MKKNKHKHRVKKTILIILIIITLILSCVFIKLYLFPSVKFILKGDKNYVLSYGSNYEEKGFIAKVNGRNVSNEVIVEDKNLDITKLGEYKITYKLKLLLGQKYKITRKVKVVDTDAPVIELVHGTSMRIDYGTGYVEPGYVISDNYDKVEDIKVNITYEKEINPTVSGDYIIAYEAIDTSGNVNKITRTVTVSPYEKIRVIDGITFVDGVLIANKKYSLPTYYNPGINSEAYNQLLKLNSDATKVGYRIPLISGFRSYSDQKTIYYNYVSIYGQAQTDTFSARPGTSEHQTGLAFDVGKLDDNYGNTNEGVWLAENAHRYGFIIRYPKGKQHITGYQYEPWHIRYLGVDLATKVYNSGLTLEEYLGIEGI
jgi:hypothetical protein